MSNSKLIIIFGLVAIVSLAYAAEDNKKDNESVLRLFKGSFDKDNKFKYHVTILQTQPNDTLKVLCGGAIIDDRYVLTAAHCVYERKKQNLFIRSGWDLEPEKPQLEKRSFHRIAKIMYPKDFANSSCRRHQHDIAILKLSRGFDLTLESQFKKVNLPSSNNDFENYEALFTGYGIHKIGKVVNNATREVVKEVPLYPKQLKYMTTKVISNEECQKDAPTIITQSNLCTQAENADGFSCTGDDGGPLVYDGVVIGIRTSHNNNCIHFHSEIFTRVSTYLSFIHKVLNREFSYQITYL